MLQPLYLVGHGLANRRQDMALGCPLEQFEPQLGLKPPQAPTDRCRVKPCARGHIGETRMAAHIEQEAEIVPVHYLLPAILQVVAAILSIYRNLYARYGPVKI